MWILAGAMLGFAVAALFAGVLRWPRRIYLFPYVLLVMAFLCGYARRTRLDLTKHIRDHWGWGLIGGTAAGVFAVQSVLRQPSSSPPGMIEFIVDLLWLGIVYGTVDGLLLSVLPVVAIQKALDELPWTSRWPGRMGKGAIALFASMVVILVYHLGYPEFRSAQVMFPVLGVSVMSLAFIVTGNPMSAVISHVAMHVAAVVHGLNTVMQLPPHY
jgi:hypothetical protein